MEGGLRRKPVPGEPPGHDHDRPPLTAAAFDRLVQAEQRRIYRILLGLIRDPEAAETLTQECFLRAYRARDGFRGDASPETWLVRIAVNLGRDHLKSRRSGFWRRLLSLDRLDANGEAGVPEVAEALARAG